MSKPKQSAAAFALTLTALISLTSAAEAQPSANAAGSPPSASSTWQVTSKTSALDGKTTYAADLLSTNQLANSAGVMTPVRLIVRCTPNEGLELYLSWPLFMGLEAQTAAYRIDDQPVVRESWGADKAGTAIFLQEDVKLFLDKLSAAKRLVVQASGYHQTPSEAVFDLGGVAEVAAAAEKACS